MKRILFFSKTLFFLLLLGTNTGQAQNWTGNINSDWNNSANWTGWPLTGDDIVIDPANYTGASASPVISSNSVFIPAGMLVQNGALLTINANLTCNDRAEIIGAGTTVVLNSGTVNAAGAGSDGRFIVGDGATMTMNGGTLMATERVIVELGGSFTMTNGTIDTDEIAVGDGNATTSSSFTMHNGTINIAAMGFENEAGVFYPGFYMHGGTLNISGDMSWLGEAPGAGSPRFIMTGGTANVQGNVINDPLTTVDLYLELSGNSVFNFSGTLVDLVLATDSVVMQDLALFNLNSTASINNAGVVHATGGTSVFNGNTSLAGTGSYTFHHMIINTAKTLSHTTSSNLHVNGNFENNGSFNANAHTVVFDGTTQQNISGSSITGFHGLTLDNGAGLMLNQAANLTGHLQLTQGKLSTSLTNMLTLADNASAGPGSDSAFVNGPLKKIGNDAFVFPVGKNESWRRLGISAPASATSEFTAEYFDTAYTSITPVNPPLTAVTALEYWMLDSPVPADEVLVTLYWEDAAASAITDCAELSMAHWNGSAWANILSSSTGTCTGAGNGSLQTDTTVGASVLTFGFYEDVTVQSLSICYGDSITVGTSTYNVSGTYTDVLVASDMSDSVVITQLFVTQPVNVTQGGITLSANSIDGATYTWLDCNNGFAVIAGETANEFTAAANGSYAVLVNQGGCIDTSACFLVTTVSMIENINDHEPKVYPNPNNGRITLESTTGTYVLRDASGRIVLQGPMNQARIDLDYSAQPRGIYFLEVISTSGSEVVKLVKI